MSVGLVVTGLLVTDTSAAAIGRYALFLVFAVLVPGTLVHRALRGRSPLAIIDLGLGAATGLLLSLGAWAFFVGLGIGQFLWLWPLAVIVPFAAVPSLRQHWRLGGYPERSPVTSWLITAAVLLYMVAVTHGRLRGETLPPSANLYYIDVYWNLANAAELARQVPPEVPSVAGRTLRAHWFANAHVAASHLISGVDLPTAVFRLSDIAVIAVVFALLVAVARKATGFAWPGGVAALIVVAPAQFMPWSWYRPWSSAAIVGGSPSQIFCLIALLLAVHVLIDLVRGRRLGAGWAVLALAVAAAPGSKPAVLPVVLGGLLVVLVLKLFWRQRVLPLIAAIAIMIASFVALRPLVAASSAGSGLKLFGLLAFVRPWTSYVEAYELPGTGGHVIAGLGESGAFILALLLVTTILLQYLWVLAAVPLLRREHRKDPAVAFLAGCLLAGLAATLIIDHPGASEIYFAKTVTPLAAILAAWGLSAALPWSREPLWRNIGLLAGAAAAAALTVGLAHRAGGGGTPAVPDLPRAIALPLAVLAAALLLGVTLWWVLRRVGARAFVGTGMAFFAAALISGSVVEAPWSSVTQFSREINSEPPPLPPYAISRHETVAARWVAENVPSHDLIATNVHCRQKKPKPFCDARAYWVAGLGEHRVLVESWAYTEENLAQIGRHKSGFPLFPFDDPELFAANEAAFYNPTPEGLASLCEDHKVRWLFADRLVGTVSPRLNELAELEFSNEDVQVYRLSC